MASVALLEALAVTAELTNTPISAAGAKVLAADLAGYPEHLVLGALARCRKELKGRMTVGDILTRMDDGRPGPEEAWAMLPRNEDTTVVWTTEMAEAWGVARPLIEERDRVAARMAFLEAYRTRVLLARDAGKPVKWTASIGHDKDTRNCALQDAVEKGRLTHERALALGYSGPECHLRIAQLVSQVKAISVKASD